jgi:hypothetical protein
LKPQNRDEIQGQDKYITIEGFLQYVWVLFYFVFVAR